MESQTHEVNNTELKFEWSSINNPSSFQSKLKEDASRALSLCKTRIRDHKITKTDLPKEVCKLLKVDDPKNNVSENLARACVATSLTEGLSQYMDDPQSIKITPANQIVSTVLDVLRGKTNTVTQKVVLSEKQKQEYANAYAQALTNNVDISSGSGTSRRTQPIENTPSNNLLDMNQIAAEQTLEMMNKVKTAGKDGQNKLQELMQKTSDDVKELAAESERRANTEAEKLRENIDKTQKDLETQAMKDEADKKAMKAKKTAAAEKQAKSRIQKFLLKKDVKEHITTLKQQKKNSTYIAAELLEKYPKLAESAMLVKENDESLSDLTDRVKTVLEGLYF